MAKKKRSVLPRVTVLAYNRRDLAAFAQAVEALGLHVRDLQQSVQLLKQKTNRPKPTTTAPENGTS